MYSTYRNSKVTCTYQHLVRLWAHVRSPAMGKPYPRSSTLRFRMNATDHHIDIEKGATRVARVSPDNVLTLCVSPDQLVTSASFFDMAIYRVGAGKYRGHHMLQLNHTAQHMYAYHRKHDPMIYVGTQIDLNTGRVLNPQPDIKRVVTNVDADREWKRKVTEYRRGWDIRAKMGAIDNVVNEMRQTVERRTGLTFGGEYLMHIIETQDYDKGMQDILLYDIPWYYWRHDHGTTLARARTSFKRTYNNYRTAIRKHLGLIADTPGGVLE